MFRGLFSSAILGLIASALTAFASWLCAISTSLWLFLPGRLLLGFAGGLTLPLGQTLLLDEYPDRLKAVGLGLWGLFALMPFTVGIALGGWMADEVGWRGLFYLNAILGAMIAGIVDALLYGRTFHRRAIPFDFVGFALLTVVLLGSQTILNQGNDFDWFSSPFLRVMLTVVLLALPAFVLWELGTPYPAVDFRLFRHRNFTVGVVVLTLGFFCLQGLLSMFVVQLQILLGYSASLAGREFLPMMVLGTPMLLLAHVYSISHRIDARIVACVTCLGFAGTLFWIGLFDDPYSFNELFWPMLLEGVFLGSFFIPLNMLTLHGLPNAKILTAAEAATFFRIAAGGLGISTQGVVVFRRTPFHQLHLADHFGGRISIAIDPLQDLSATLAPMGFDPTVLTRQLGILIRQESGILAMNDAFLLSSAIFLALAAVVWGAFPTRYGGAEGAEEWRIRKAEELMEEI